MNSPQIWNKDSIQIRNSEVCSRGRDRRSWALAVSTFPESRVVPPLQPPSKWFLQRLHLKQKYFTNTIQILKKKIIQISNEYHTNIKLLPYVSSPVNGWPSITTHLQMISAKTAFEWMLQKYFTNIIQISYKYHTNIMQISNKYHANIEREQISLKLPSLVHSKSKYVWNVEIRNYLKNHQLWASLLLAVHLHRLHCFDGTCCNPSRRTLADHTTVQRSEFKRHEEHIFQRTM